MQIPLIPENEDARITELEHLHILDTPIQESFERITRLAKSLFKVPIVAFSLIDHERQWFKSIQGLDVCETSREVSFCGHTINQDDIFIVSDTLLDDRFKDNPLVVGEPKIRFYAGYPVRTPNKFKIGSLCLIDTTPRQFTNDELSALKDLVALVEAEIASNKIAYEQFTRIKELDYANKSALIDGVTRLWNRKAVQDLLENRVKTALQSQKAFGIALIDIDHFKIINDTYGHCAGDDILRDVAKRLVASYRDHDIIGRWGGEEFLVIINIDDSKKLFEIADRTRVLISGEIFSYQGKSIPVTVTTGIKIFDWKNPVDILCLVGCADKALYAGKSQGRNVVIDGDAIK